MFDDQNVSTNKRMGVKNGMDVHSDVESFNELEKNLRRGTESNTQADQSIAAGNYSYKSALLSPKRLHTTSEPPVPEKKPSPKRSPASKTTPTANTKKSKPKPKTPSSRSNTSPSGQQRNRRKRKQSKKSKTTTKVQQQQPQQLLVTSPLRSPLARIIRRPGSPLSTSPEEARTKDQYSLWSGPASPFFESRLFTFFSTSKEEADVDFYSSPQHSLFNNIFLRTVNVS